MHHRKVRFAISAEGCFVIVALAAIMVAGWLWISKIPDADDYHCSVVLHPDVEN